jgi:predicted O-linked N-acetylglucosamine transferase (SPINDLY family)
MGKARKMVRGDVAARKPRKGIDVEALVARAALCERMGLAADARSHYRQILCNCPNHARALHSLGVSEFLAGQPEIAVRLITRALLADPTDATAHCNLATVLLALHRLDQALIRCDTAIALRPDYADAHFNRGIALDGLDRLVDAILSFETALALNPSHADALNNLGNTLHRLGRFGDATASYDKAIALRPGFALAFNNRGAAYKELMQADLALADFDRVLALVPKHAIAWTNRGEALLALRRFDEALQSYGNALSIDPRMQDAMLGRANILMLTRKIDEAMAACQSALAIEPGSARALTQLGQCHARRGNTEQAIARFDQALAIKPDDEAALSNKVYTMDFSGQSSFAQQQQARSDWWRQIGSRIAAQAPLQHSNDRDPARRIVLGYVSSDFMHRSAAFAVRPILENHDKHRFEVICYSGSATQDAVTDSFRRAADRWRDVSQWPDDRLVDCIRADKVDILTDLSGHSGGNRLRVFARKPAPIQVTAWGHNTGTGLPTIDYLLSDPVLIPAAVRPLFAERIYDLPTAMIIEPPPVEARCATPPVLSNGYLTYGVFNRVSKISDAAIRVWARILHSNTAARLVIKDESIDDPSIQRTLRERFAACGLPQDRIDLMGASPRTQHLSAYRLVDICLDPFPQGGGVSTWEALYMGLPVVTKLGDVLPSRVASAIMTGIGMTEWVAANDDEYAQIALRATPDLLSTIRRELPARISERCSPATYTAAVETAYRTMWENYCEAPQVDAAAGALADSRTQ